MKKIKKQKGFTLIELLVVISIIALLSSVILAGLNDTREKARDSKRISQIKQIQTALEFYYDKYGFYPYNLYTGDCNVGDFGNSLDVLVTDNFLPEYPNDPVGVQDGTNNLCFQYLGYGNAGWPGQSSWFCDEVRRTDYQYALFFSTENTVLDYSRVRNSSGNIISNFEYCVPGPLI
jgi:prepilin-type N-terminal cleavage/methylation domain-containing protein